MINIIFALCELNAGGYAKENLRPAKARLAGLRLFDIKRAWFNEDQCCEFFPRTVLAHTN
jgi:hypothetical protein